MWKTISSKVILNHPRLKVLEDKVELHNGHKTDYVRIDARGCAATVIAVNDSGQILIQKEYSYPPNEVLYQFPGGHVPENEDTQVGANRELQEEAGLKSNNLQLLGEYFGHNRRSAYKVFVFLAQDLEQSNLDGDLEEDIKSYWFSEHEIDDLIRNGEIRNASVLAAWSLFKLRKT